MEEIPDHKFPLKREKLLFPGMLKEFPCWKSRDSRNSRWELSDKSQRCHKIQGRKEKLSWRGFCVPKSEGKFNFQGFLDLPNVDLSEGKAGRGRRAPDGNRIQDFGNISPLPSQKTPVRGFNPAVKPWIGGILPKSQLCILGFGLKGGEIPVEKGDSDSTEVGIFPLPGRSDPGGIPGGSRLIPGDSMETSWDMGEGGIPRGDPEGIQGNPEGRSRGNPGKF